MEEKEIKQANEINEEEKDKKKNRAILLIIGIATVLIALIGATFAYFTAQVNNVNGDQSVAVTTATVQGVIYTSNDAILLNNAMPGDHAEGTFTIENPNETATAQYMLIFVPDFDNFVLTPTDEGDETTDMVEQLMLYVSGGPISGTLSKDYTDGENAARWVITKDVETSGDDYVSLPATETHTYTARINFAEIDKNQDANKSTGDRSVSFYGHFEVQQKVTAQTSNP